MSALLTWIVNTLWDRWIVQNLNKVLEHFGLDKVMVKFIPDRFRKTKTLEIKILSFGFLNISPGAPPGVYTLPIELEPKETLSIERITILFNRPGGNGAYEIASFDPPRRVHGGETSRLIILHYRNGVGAFWGDVTPITESRILDKISKEQQDEFIRRHVFEPGSYNCEVVVLHSNGETRLGFTVLNPFGNGKPGIVHPGDHKAYNPNRR